MFPPARKSVLVFHHSEGEKKSAHDERNRCEKVRELPLSMRLMNQCPDFDCVTLRGFGHRGLKPEGLTSIPAQKILRPKLPRVTFIYGLIFQQKCHRRPQKARLWAPVSSTTTRSNSSKLVFSRSHICLEYLPGTKIPTFRIEFFPPKMGFQPFVRRISGCELSLPSAICSERHMIIRQFDSCASVSLHYFFGAPSVDPFELVSNEKKRSSPKFH